MRECCRILGIVLVLGVVFGQTARAQSPHHEQFRRERAALQAEFYAVAAEIKGCMARYKLPASDIRLSPEAQKQNMQNRCGLPRLKQMMDQIAAHTVAFTHAQAARNEERNRLEAEASRKAQVAQQPKPQAPAKPSRRETVLSGNWAASCVERNGGVVCQRFGGFLSNQFPEGCQGNSLLTCKGRDLCSLAAEVTIVVNGNPRLLQPNISGCPGARRPPST